MVEQSSFAPAINLAALELSAAAFTQNSQRISESNNMPAPNRSSTVLGSRPLAIVTKPAPKKSQKRMRTEPEDNDDPHYPQPLEELLKMTIFQLRKVAQEHSKHAMSAADEQFFLDFYGEQEIQLVIKAIERGVLMSMVNSLLGRRLAFKEANRWNRFLQTDQAQLIFQQSGLGVNDKTVMKALSEAYHQLSDEEKAALVAEPIATDLAADGTPLQESSKVQAMSDTVPQESATHRRALNVAKSCSCEFVFFAVSNHLGSHSFQLVRTTPGATAIQKVILDNDGNNNYSARLQAYLTRGSISQVAAAK
ncbi:hypothetical protein PtB15_12B544 [Puccinia triticina]|nr:hypothetical protein PtB15_12B544 [Puccinia triticina]